MTHEEQVNAAAEKLRYARKVAPRSATTRRPDGAGVRALEKDGLPWCEVWDRVQEINPAACR